MEKEPQDSRSGHRRPAPGAIAAGLAALAIAAGGGAAWWTARNSTLEQSSVPTPTVTVPASKGEIKQATEKTLQVYWLKSVDNRIALFPSQLRLKSNAKSEALLQTAFKQLLTGPSDPTNVTSIPQGTELRKLNIEPDGVHVDLSQAFTQGGGATSITSRVAQVVYTATSLNPTSPVWISVEGQPLDVLGGEGLLLEQPLTRQKFQQNFNL